MKEPTQTSDRGWLYQVFVENYPLKLVSLAFAVALFAIVHGDQDAQRSLYVDVVALSPPVNADAVLISTLPARVKVTLRGSRSRLAALERDDFAPIQMDLRDPGRQFYYFDASSIGLSGPFRVVAIEPASVQLDWRPRVEHAIPVRIKLTGNPAAGYVVKQPITVAPSDVTISGPKEEVEGFSYASTEEISAEGLGPGVHEIRGRLEPLSGHVSYLAQGVVTVRVEVESETSERTFSSLEVSPVGPGDVTLRPKTVQVTLRGPAPQLVKLVPEQLVPFVELNAEGGPSSVESLPVQLQGLPEACSVVQIVPTTVLARRERR